MLGLSALWRFAPIRGDDSIEHLSRRILLRLRAAEALLTEKSTVQEPRELLLVPHEEISLNEIRRISIPLYGMASWGRFHRSAAPDAHNVGSSRTRSR